MLARSFKHNFHKVIWLTAITLILAGSAITGLALAASTTTPFHVKTNCKANAAKLMNLMEANAPLYR